MEAYKSIQTLSDIGRLVRADRKQRGMVQAELASFCGVSPRFISELENGKGTMQFNKVMKVVRILGISVMAGK